MNNRLVPGSMRELAQVILGGVEVMKQLSELKSRHLLNVKEFSADILQF